MSTYFYEKYSIRLHFLGNNVLKSTQHIGINMYYIIIYPIFVSHMYISVLHSYVAGSDAFLQFGRMHGPIFEET